ncbi:MAG TPA: C-GCAxxG-C-C family protein [Kineosporiaceae bacterium]|nr:C-GCAxxG-C-C family protein [Kineosporiaceae bacterium]
MDDTERILELGRDGFQCSQILVLLGLQLQGRSSPELVRSMQGLAGGMSAGETCGALTGGACLLGLYAGRGDTDEEDDPRLLFMLDELVRWFREGYGAEYGSLRCDDIVGPCGQHLADRCPRMVAGVYAKAKDLLVETGFELTGMPG